METKNTIQAPWRNQSEEVVRYFLLNRRILEANDTVYFYANAGDYIFDGQKNYFATLESGIFKMKNGVPEHFCSTEGFRAMVRTGQVQGIGTEDFEKILIKQKDIKNIDIRKPYNKFVYSPEAYLLRNETEVFFKEFSHLGENGVVKTEETLENDASPFVM